MLATALGKVRASDFGGPDRRELTNWLLKCPNMERREARMRIINDLPEPIRTSRLRDDQNDRSDIRGIVDACLNYSGGLKDLMSILSEVENNSEQLQGVENYLENFLQQKHIIAPDPEVEKQIEQLTALLVSIQVTLHNTDLEQAYHASAPQLDFLDPTWRFPQDSKIANVLDRVLHHLNVAPTTGPGVPPLLIFVERLACYTQEVEKQQTLRIWIDKEAEPTWHVKAEAISMLRQQLTEEAGSPAATSAPVDFSDSHFRTGYICYLSNDKLAALFAQVDTKTLQNYGTSYRNMMSLSFGEAADRPDNERKRRIIVSQLSLILDYLERTANIGQLAEILRENGQLNCEWYHLQAVFRAEPWKASDYQVFLLGKIEGYHLRLSCSKSNFPGLSREGDTYIPTSTNAFLFNGDVGLYLRGLVRLINVDHKAKAISGTPLYLVLSTDFGKS